jgi:DNA mismatch repair protein MutL
VPCYLSAVPTVAILPAEVADQIAAGEVVERPASAVKELLENAVDAGATVIDIDVSDGGRTAIRVSDDGCGMDRADAVLALQRHATSKIRRAEDLVGVRSFGFRGEALPAIASVSRLRLETARSDGSGTSVRVDGGAVAEVGDVARRRGTTVAVTHLFYNVPARLKFMRGVRSEWRAVADTVTSVALAQRAAHITLSHDGKQMMMLPPATTLRARVGAVWGPAYADSLAAVEDTQGAVRVSGLVERPSDVGTRTRRIHLSVNGRAIRDAGLVRAAEAAYRSTIPAGLRPSLLLELEVAPEAVDVNVHPAKAEVRFRDRWPVERAIEAAVRRALGSVASAAALGARVWAPGGHGAMGNGHSPTAPWMDTGAAGAAHEMGFDGTIEAPHGLLWPAADARGLATAPGTAQTSAGTEIEVPPLLQLRHTYLLFERAEGLVLIDQHSAHERVLYERFLGALEQGAMPAQQLLFPLTLHLGAAALDAFEAHRELFARLGFEVEGFGGHTLVVRGAPAPHDRFDAERCLRDTLDALTGDRLPGTAARHERLAATVACKAAIKAGDALSTAEMRALFVALARTSLPAHDVHGRSTVVWLPWVEVERRFGRR